MVRAVLVIPANNSTMEAEIRALCPEIDVLDVARVPRPARSLTHDDIPAYLDATLAAVKPFAERPVDIVLYGCTAAGFLAGPDGNRRVASELGRLTGAPVVSTADAMLDVLREAGASRIGLVTPYMVAVNDGLRAYLVAGGIDVATLSSFACETTEALGRLTAAEVAERAVDVAATPADALFIACSQLPTLAILPDLRTRLGRPVWSSIAATAWAASRVLVERSELAA